MTNSALVFTAAAQKAQAERGSGKACEWRMAECFPARVTQALAALIAEQDTAHFGTATVRAEIAALEAENARLRLMLGEQTAERRR